MIRAFYKSLLLEKSEDIQAYRICFNSTVMLYRNRYGGRACTGTGSEFHATLICWQIAHIVLNASSLRERPTHTRVLYKRGCSQNYVGKSVVSLIPTLNPHHRGRGRSNAVEG